MVIGHKRQLQLLDLHVRTGALSHVYLFSGPRHVGKMSIARRMAAAILCEKRNTGKGLLFSCGSCRACRAGTAGAHPDIFTVDTEQSNSTSLRLEDIQHVRERAYMSAYGGTQVFFIRDVSKMTREAANALIKLLEEPRGQVLFFLLASVVGDVLETIRSRVWHVRFWPASEELLKETPALFRASIAERLACAEKLRDNADGMRAIFTKNIFAASRALHTSLQEHDNARAVAAADACRTLMETEERFVKPYATKRIIFEEMLIALP